MSEQAASAILRRQNSPRMQDLVRAMSVSHKHARHLDAVSTLVSVVVAGSGFVATLVPAAATSITLVGALWALIYSAGLATWTGSELIRGATLQEMFDTQLFAIAWNHVIAPEPLGAHEISRLSKRYRGREDMVENYYEIPDLPRPFDVLACQLQNLGWGARVHLRYAYSVLALVWLWGIAGVAVGALAGLTIAQVLLSWYVPSLGAIMLGLDIFRNQRDVSVARQRVLRVVRRAIATTAHAPMTAAAMSELTVLARQTQDAIYLTRRHTPRVPDWYFLRFRSSDAIDFRAEMDDLSRALHPGMGSGSGLSASADRPTSSG